MLSFARLALLGLAQAVSTPAREADRVPDVLLVVLDDVGLTDVDAIATPTLDYLASEGVSFRRAYANPVCSPTRHSLLFGEFYGEIAGDTCSSFPSKATSPAVFSLPKMAKGVGYGTGLFGKWHVGSNPLGDWALSPHLHGFDVWRAGIPSNIPQCGGNSYWDWKRVDDGVVTRSSQYQTEALRDELLAWWTSTPSPRFAYVGLQNAHSPHHAPPASFLPSGFVVGSTRRDLYEAMVVSADLVLGEILAYVDLRTTWVIVIGDNGTPPEAVAAGQNNNKVKGTTFEEGVKVPLVIAGPGAARGAVSESLVHACDLLATIADLAHARIPAGAARDSRSLVPILRDPAARVREFVISDHVPDNRSMPGQPSGQDRAVITERWKLRRVAKTLEELYDLEHDPDELRPLDPSKLLDPAHARIVEALRSTLDAYEARP
jgi:arylsulfatase B